MQGRGGRGQRQCHPLYKKGVCLRYVEARACTLVVVVVVVRRITEVGLLLYIHGVHPADIVGSLCEKKLQFSFIPTRRCTALFKHKIVTSFYPYFNHPGRKWDHVILRGMYTNFSSPQIEGRQSSLNRVLPFKDIRQGYLIEAMFYYVWQLKFSFTTCMMKHRDAPVRCLLLGGAWHTHSVYSDKTPL